MEDKITIIEGPPPTFEVVEDGWPIGLNESPVLADIAVTQMRTFNGPSLVERCHRAWSRKQTIHLEYRTSSGLMQQAPIVAARFVNVDEGHLLILWVRLMDEAIELELGYDDDYGEESDDDLFPPDYP